MPPLCSALQAEYTKDLSLRGNHLHGQAGRLHHKWYMESRSITMNDEYAFNPDKEVTLDPFIEILERHFKTPKEGLGFDNSPVAHMWRSMAEPLRPL